MNGKTPNQKNMDTMMQVTQKTSIGQRVAVAVGVLGVVGAIVGISLALAPGGGTATKPSAPTLLSPTNGATGQGTTTNPPYVTLDWSDASGATSYKVFYGTSTTPPLVATVSAALAIADDLEPADASRYNVNVTTETLYYWYVQACNRAGCTTSTPSRFSFTSLTQYNWLAAQPFTVPEGFGQQVCGADDACDARDPTNVLDCAEFGRIWLACNGFENKCPENKTEKCMQKTICRCNDKSGRQECQDYLATLTNPC